jgi:glycosyltransferase involved in cell wall biosynthesis
MIRLLCLNLAGENSTDSFRIRKLTEGLSGQVVYYDADRSTSRWHLYQEIQQLLASQTWDLVYQENTGISGGANLIQAARSWGQPYLISTGDPVGGFFQVTKGPLWGGGMGLYEKLLYQHCAGFMGWTPYLTGLALHLGAKRAVTIEGAVDLAKFYPLPNRSALKIKYGLNPNHLICGVVGSLKWTERQHYCYGLELVQLLSHLQRTDVSVLIVGDGDGRARLQQMVPLQLKDRVHFTGRVPFDEVIQTMNAIDIGFIAQTLDSLGSYRLTTKLPEFLACGTAIAMSPIPGYYDYAQGAGWPLPVHHPASPVFHRQCAAWLDTLTWEQVDACRRKAPILAEQRFDYQVLQTRFRAFLESIPLNPT